MTPARGALLGRRQFAVMLIGAWTEGARERDEPMTSVEIRDFTFLPDRLAVRAGQTVEWINQDDVPHSIIHAAHPHLFKSGVLFHGERFAFRFERPGRYPYFCGVYRHMRGAILVG